MDHLKNLEKEIIEKLEWAKGFSQDRSKKTSAMIFEPNNLSTAIFGANTFTRGMDEKQEHIHQRPAKYDFTEHAERNAIYAAAKLGTGTEGLWMATSWFPCSSCARAIVQSGISALCFIEDAHTNTNTEYGFDAAKDILAKGGVVLIKLNI